MSRKRHKFDPVATKLAGFKDRRSYITIQGKRFLFGIDKSALRMRCYERAQGACCKCGRFTGWEHGEMDHEIPLGQGGDDSDSNVRWMCGRFMQPPCHVMLHGRYPRWTPKAAEVEA